MDAIASSPGKSMVRQPLVGIDANQRSLSTSSASQMALGIEVNDGKASLSSGKSSLTSANASALVEERVVMGKRTVDELEDKEGRDELEESAPNKKRRISLDCLTETVEILREDVPAIKVKSVQEMEKETQEGIVDGYREQLAHKVTATSTQTSSPPSTFQSSQLLCSQSTEITEPDHSDSQETHQIQTKQQANELRLRLRIAMYKVHTNQVSVPLSRLEIRSGSYSSSWKSKSTNRNKLHLPAAPSMPVPPAPEPKEIQAGEAVVVAARTSSVQPGFQEATPPNSQQTNPNPNPNLNSSFRYDRFNPRSQAYTNEVRNKPSYHSHIYSHTHPKPTPYSSQKRKIIPRERENSVTDDSDIELEIPPPKHAEKGKKADWKRDLQNAVKRIEMRRRREGEGDGNVDVMKARQADEDDLVEGAAGGLLELMGALREEVRACVEEGEDF